MEQEEENKKVGYDEEVQDDLWNQDEDEDEDDGWWDKHPSDNDLWDKDKEEEDHNKEDEGKDKEEEEDWWDSEEEPCTPSQVIDPAEFEVSSLSFNNTSQSPKKHSLFKL